ncbi:Dopamine receptor 2, partial [Gryllus bimaculatus]
MLPRRRKKVLPVVPARPGAPKADARRRDAPLHAKRRRDGERLEREPSPRPAPPAWRDEVECARGRRARVSAASRGAWAWVRRPTSVAWSGVGMDAVGPNATALAAAAAAAADNATDAASPPMQLNVVYTVFEVLVAVAAVVGNALVMLVFHRERRLRRRTNYYIVSLAAADFLVGLLGIPFAILASVGLPRDLHACLFTVSLLVVLCTISIFCLVAVSVDRYWAILHPMGYSRNVRTKTAIGIIGVCWLAGSLVGFLPLFGWHEPSHGACLFTKVMDYNYLVFLYFATIVVPALLLACFYVHIYRVVLKQLRRIVTMNP